ncbi:MAG: hypothetical protein ACKVZ0_04365 [Gemmatimonadales bacterium]
MTYYPDLTRCSYFDDEIRRTGSSVASVPLIAVGWLDDRLPNPPGTPGALAPVADALVRLWLADVDLWRPALGYHGCRLCGRSPDRAPTEVDFSGRRLHVGKGFVSIPAPRGLYVAPSMIIHYILSHGYEPPAAFRAALETCPDPHSPAYGRALRRHGPWWWRWEDRRHLPLPGWRRWIAARIDWHELEATAGGRGLRWLVQRL